MAGRGALARRDGAGAARDGLGRVRLLEHRRPRRVAPVAVRAGLASGERRALLVPLAAPVPAAHSLSTTSRPPPDSSDDVTLKIRILVKILSISLSILYGFT